MVYVCKSWLFYNDKKLNAAANQNSAHIWWKRNAQGSHVAKIHQVLRAYFTDGSFRYPHLKHLVADLSEDTYDGETATAVGMYKYIQHHDAGESLLNWQGHIDSVCGIKTVRSMDAWFRSRFPFSP